MHERATVRARGPPGARSFPIGCKIHEQGGNIQSRLHERVAAIEALREEDRERLREFMHRGDVLNNCLVDLMDAPEPVYPARRQEQLELLRAERDAAWGAARELEIALELPEPWPTT